MPLKFDRSVFCSRIASLRRDRYGDDVVRMALELGIPAGTWENYEAGVTVPDSILLKLLHLTGTPPSWFLTGDGDTHRARGNPSIPHL